MARGAKNAYIRHVHTGGKDNDNILYLYKDETCWHQNSMPSKKTICTQTRDEWGF